MVSVHHGRQGMAEQSKSHHGDQETEREKERERLYWLSHFSHFIPPSLATYGMILPIFGGGSPLI
jgi:hypothetical protein